MFQTLAKHGDKLALIFDVSTGGTGIDSRRSKLRMEVYLSVNLDTHLARAFIVGMI